MTVHFQKEQVEEMQRQARSAYPRECCGFLAGQVEGHERRVCAIWEVENVKEGQAAGRRYYIPPEILFKCDQQARREGLAILGLYHSHPDHHAEPSEFDRQNAVAGWSYLIFQVTVNSVGFPSAWQLKNDRSGFNPEEVRIDDRGVEE